MTAREVKDAVRARHAASARMGSRTIPGPWTVVEEFDGIDVLAIAATAGARISSEPAPRAYARVGYEVKVSRSDMRSELLSPSKRSRAVAFCNAFYFVVPQGLLLNEELAWKEPAWARDPSAYVREPCPRSCYPSRRGAEVFDKDSLALVACPDCDGRGYARKARIELKAPTLWVPSDVGLVEATRRGCKTIRRAPAHDASEMTQGQVGRLVRWTSVRPDPRHEGLIVRLRARERELRAAYGRAAV